MAATRPTPPAGRRGRAGRVQKSRAMTATPLGMVATRSTPAMARASVSWTCLTWAPKRGGCSTRAVSSPGRRTSWVKMALPSILAGPSVRRRVGLPMSLNSGRVLEPDLGRHRLSGRRLRQFAEAWRDGPPGGSTTPSLTSIPAAGTCHCAAAAATSIWRAAAPALRNCS